MIHITTRPNLLKLYLVFTLGILPPSFLKAEGQEGLVFIIDGITLLVVVFVWTVLFFFILHIMKFFRKKGNGIGRKVLTGLICSLFAIFQFIMTKSDSHPYEGPIDEFVHRKRILEDKRRDALEILNGQPDSTIDITIASIDSNEVGVYIWLNGQRMYVRKLTPDLGSQQKNDELTMRIVRSWKK